MNKKTFATIVNHLDLYYNGDISEGFAKLGICETGIDSSMDAILDVIDDEIDPERYAEEDTYTKYSGSYVCAWLFDSTEFQEICPTAEALYDYIEKKYSEAPNEDSVQLKVNI